MRCIREYLKITTKLYTGRHRISKNKFQTSVSPNKYISYKQYRYQFKVQLILYKVSSFPIIFNIINNNYVPSTGDIGKMYKYTHTAYLRFLGYRNSSLKCQMQVVIHCLNIEKDICEYTLNN